MREEKCSLVKSAWDDVHHQIAFPSSIAIKHQFYGLKLFVEYLSSCVRAVFKKIRGPGVPSKNF
jgi:hypothetical protein